MNAYANAMRRYVDFGGRSSRGDFWGFFLVYLVIGLVVIIIDQSLLPPGVPGAGFLTSLFSLMHLLPAMAVLVRRLHDTDRTGWWVLINVTGIGFFVLLVMTMLRGTEGPNRFGPDSADDDDGRADRRVSHAPHGQAESPGRLRDFTSEPAFVHAGGSSRESIASSPASPERRDVIGDLERLAKLKADGVLTDEEYQGMKAHTLSSATSG